MEFSHIDKEQKPTMVDVSEKTASMRTAVAESIVYFGKDVFDQLAAAGWSTKKGPIFDTAIIAGTMAAKKTSSLIPFCHPLNLKSVKIKIKSIDEARLGIVCTVKVTEQTGVEMEALTATSVAALTIYDMCKSFSKDIIIESTRLIKKTGGKTIFRGNE
ncbi:MAG: cyclic pyranopterin monophosphate synthase MoaC [Puniceicoccaceae bacterium]|nr:cyclic pyranopterin monophosphate synthase MoaC [Puniceicoccaceae bacterium]